MRITPAHPRILLNAVNLLGAPFGWVLQHAGGSSLASYACYPHDVPVARPVVPNLTLVLVAASLFCLAIAAASTFSAVVCWRGSKPGTQRFLAILGILSGAIFMTAIMFTLAAIILVSPCFP